MRDNFEFDRRRGNAMLEHLIRTGKVRENLSDNGTQTLLIMIEKKENICGLVSYEGTFETTEYSFKYQ
jgi:hypothetical protein